MVKRLAVRPNPESEALVALEPVDDEAPPMVPLVEDEVDEVSEPEEDEMEEVDEEEDEDDLDLQVPLLRFARAVFRTKTTKATASGSHAR